MRNEQVTPYTANKQKWMRIAALLMPLVAAAFYFIFRPAPPLPVTANKTYQPKNPEVQLMFHGKLLRLTGDSAIQELNFRGVQLRNGPNGLAYTDNGGDSDLNRLYIPLGGAYRVTLSDSTVVWLDANSRLDFPFTFTGDKREVYLYEGRAYFQVAPNSAPFIVHGSRVTVQGLGIAFNVNNYDSNETVSLVRGAVSVTGYDSSMAQLQPGKEALYGNSGGFVVRDFEKEQVLDWMKGRYAFHNATLAGISATLERWYDVRFVFDQPILANTVVSGVAEKNKLPDFLQGLQTSAHIDYYFTGRKLHFYVPEKR